MKCGCLKGLLAAALLAAPALQVMADEDARMLKQGQQRITLTVDTTSTRQAFDAETGSLISFANYEAAQLGLSGLVADAGMPVIADVAPSFLTTVV